MSLDVVITNAEGSRAFAEINGCKLDLYIDKSDTANVKVSSRHSISKDASIEIARKGKPLFRGRLKMPAVDKSNQIDLQFADIVSQLDYRYAQEYTYPAGTPIEQILSSSVPTAGGVVGLLYLASSLVPIGMFHPYLGSPCIQKCRGYGTTNYPSIGPVYEDGELLTLAGSPSGIGSWQYCQDADYLYTYIPSDKLGVAEIMIGSPQVQVPGAWYAYAYAFYGGGFTVSANTYRIEGGGVNSQFGEVTDIYKGTTKLTVEDSPYNMADDTFYQDDYDIFIKIPDAETLEDYPITIPGFKDTAIVLGNISIEGWTFDTDFTLTKDKISKNLTKLLDNVYAAEYEYIYSVDGNTYLDIVEQQGKGTEAEPVHVWRIEELQDFKETANKEAQTNCILATGLGTPNIHAASGNLLPCADWCEVGKSYQTGDVHELWAMLDRQIEFYSDPRTYTFDAVPVFGLRCGDLVKILRRAQKQPPIYSRIQKISYDGDNSMEITLGHRQREIRDVWDLVKGEA